MIHLKFNQSGYLYIENTGSTNKKIYMLENSPLYSFTAYRANFAGDLCYGFYDEIVTIYSTTPSDSIKVDGVYFNSDGSLFTTTDTGYYTNILGAGQSRYTFAGNGAFSYNGICAVADAYPLLVYEADSISALCNSTPQRSVTIYHLSPNQVLYDGGIYWGDWYANDRYYPVYNYSSNTLGPGTDVFTIELSNGSIAHYNSTC